MTALNCPVFTRLLEEGTEAFSGSLSFTSTRIASSSRSAFQGHKNAVWKSPFVSNFNSNLLFELQNKRRSIWYSDAMRFRNKSFEGEKKKNIKGNTIYAWRSVPIECPFSICIFEGFLETLTACGTCAGSSAGLNHWKSRTRLISPSLKTMLCPVYPQRREPQTPETTEFWI